MSDECRIQNVHRYTRTTYKNVRNAQGHEARAEADVSPRGPGPGPGPREPQAGPGRPSCSCDLDPEQDLATILHKKCPVINLAQQQLNRLLDETNKILCEDPQPPSCRSCYEFFCICKELLMNYQKLLVLFYIAAMFLTGLLMGAATCGSYLGKFNSPILTCIENLFIPDNQLFVQDSYSYYSVV